MFFYLLRGLLAGLLIMQGLPSIRKRLAKRELMMRRGRKFSCSDCVCTKVGVVRFNYYGVYFRSRILTGHLKASHLDQRHAVRREGPTRTRRPDHQDPPGIETAQTS